ncbi:MAG: hypothetical protein Q8O64_09390 [Sideroxyarcus sp.]|nr:hypothetical protein [Sideroxyarcus sp.]
MKAQVVGFSRMSGTSQKTGRAYDMCKVVILQPSQNASTEHFNRASVGYEAVELDALPDAQAAFLAIPKFPALVDLKIDNIVRGGKLQPVVIGVE